MAIVKGHAVMRALALLFFVSVLALPGMAQALSGEDDARFDEARSAVDSLRRSGVSVSTLEDLISRMDGAESSGDVSSAREAAYIVISSAREASQARAKLSEVDALIRSAESRGLDMRDSRVLSGLALASLQREQYSAALDRASQAQTVAHVESSKVRLGWLLRRYWLAWVCLLVLLIVALVAMVWSRRVYFISRRIRALEAEERAVSALVQDAYRRRYKTRELAASAFHREMYRYIHRQKEIREQVLRLRSARARARGVGSELDALERERRQVEAMLSKAQQAHLVAGSMTEQQYHPLIHELHERLAEIDEAFGVMRAMESQRPAASEQSKSGGQRDGFDPAGRAHEAGVAIGSALGHIASFFRKGFNRESGGRAR